MCIYIYILYSIYIYIYIVYIYIYWGGGGRGVDCVFSFHANIVASVFRQESTVESAECGGGEGGIDEQ